MLSLEKAQPRYLRPERPISVSAVPFGPGFDIWRSCRFIGAMMRFLCLLPGGLVRFVPCSIGALLAGTLPLRYCAARFACRTPTWRLPESGHVAGLVTAVAGVEGEAVVDCAADEVSWVSGSGPGRKRIRLNMKTPAHLVVSVVRSHPRVWKRLRHLGHSSLSLRSQEEAW